MLSVIIPARNAAQHLESCLVALRQQSQPELLHEIIVVDNGSTDATAEIGRRHGATVIYQPRPGAAAARNAGIAAASGPIICFTDADCRPTADWLAQLSAPLRQDPTIMGCKGVYRTDQPELVARFVQIEYEDKYDLLRPQPTIDFIDTYSAAYRREALVANNGFDEGIFYVEDQELSFRLAARGYKMVFQPSAAVYHLHAHTLGGYFRKKFYIAYWKAQVVRRFPERAVKDSHTPQVMKVQMALITLLGAGLTAVPLWPQAGLLVSLLLTLLFGLTCVPFVRKAWGKDKGVATAAPLLLAVRALALSAGYVAGIAFPQAGLHQREATIGGLNYLAKRGLDIVGGLVGLALAAVLGPFIALAIKLDSTGPAIFTQQRVGQGGKPFTIYKFRSMRHGAEAELAQLVDLDTLQEPMYKLVDDPRVTRVGRWLRRWSLDELPQFWNVVRGDMSLVGPRPEEVQVVAHYNDWHRRRLMVKPGISGPMQINGRGDLSLNHRIQLELDYIEHYSLWRDIAILVRTIPSVLRGKGAR